MKYFSILLLTFILGTSAYAHDMQNPLCDTELSNVEISGCMAEKVEDLEALVAAEEARKIEEHKEFLATWDSPLAENTPLVEELIQSSKDFKQYMASECQYQKTQVLTGSAAGSVYAGCKINLLKLRLEFLKGY